MLKENVNKELLLFGSNVIDRAKFNFARKNLSGEGSKSMVFTTASSAKMSEIVFLGEDYMMYQDKGVSGTERKFNTPFKYTNKRPPIMAFNGYTIRRGFAPRDKKGRFLPRKALLFALANHIFKQGIRPSLFFTNAINSLRPELVGRLATAYIKDIEIEAAKINDTK